MNRLAGSGQPGGPFVVNLRKERRGGTVGIALRRGCRLEQRAELRLNTAFERTEHESPHPVHESPAPFAREFARGL